MNIHEQLKNIRNLTGMTQRALGNQAGCTQKQVSFIEGGKDCYLSTIRALLGVLGYDLAAVPKGMTEGGKNGVRN